MDTKSATKVKKPCKTIVIDDRNRSRSYDDGEEEEEIRRVKEKRDQGEGEEQEQQQRRPMTTKQPEIVEEELSVAVEKRKKRNGV
ncbi:unnamed protein product [Microthlaspi erraticum]|uniref:Uncharacterized protein n=1 Tax=Microthlaspi erraticum TaxID=1685480 RepID=A0A6D2JQD2_9BRAS|nr:unnamed protein product [Microthlaspi erraticum]